MTYVLLTRFTDARPELELFSELPKMDFTIPSHNHDTATTICSDYEHGPHPIQYDLYEGHIDGGDSMEISILHCETCNEHHAVQSFRIINYNDPTELYMLTCGHETMGF